jgi:phage baseplate assembly protein W
MLKFLGAPYPIEATAKGYLATTYGLDTMKADLLILLLTNPGERVMLPTFGTPLQELVFEQNDTVLEDRARQMIIDAVSRWEPRVVIDAIEVSSRVDADFLASTDDATEKDKVLGIRILFKDPQNITQVEELILEVPLQK